MNQEDRKLIERYLSGEGNIIDRQYIADEAREAVRRLLEEYEWEMNSEKDLRLD